MKTRRLSLVACVVSVLLLSASGWAADAPTTLDVWPDKAPGETNPIPPEKAEKKPVGGGKTIDILSNVSKPTLTVYRPAKEKDSGVAVVICPGGGYSILAFDLEGTEVAEWLNSIGVTGIVLKYRVPQRPNLPRWELPLQDAQRAMSLVRSKAAQWGIDPKRIGLLGFSAGGNLTGVACTHFEKRAYDSIDDVDKVSCRPDFGVLVYPAWLNQEGTDKLAPEITVSSQTPQMFFVHASDDPISMHSSVAMYLALKQTGIAAEMHLYATGGHGFGLRKTEKPCSMWPERCEEWMRSQGILRPLASASH